MGCNSEYMEPNVKESESKLTAELLVYVHKELGFIPQQWVIDAANHVYGSPSQLDTLVSGLCSFCKDMSKEEQDKIIYDGRNPTARKLATWWERHQEADKKRIAKEWAEKEKKKIIESALSKLTDDEKKALGY